MGQKESSTGMCLEWPHGKPEYQAVPAEDRARVIAQYRRESSNKDSPAAKMTFPQYAAWYAIPPPAVVGGSAAYGRVEAWHAQCLGEDWAPSTETAPGLASLRWYIPGRSGDWLSLYDSKQRGTSRTLILETIKLYTAPLVLVLRLDIGCFGIVFKRFPQRTAVFYAAGKRLRVVSDEVEAAPNTQASFIAATRAIPVEEFGAPHVRIADSFQEVEVLNSELHSERHHYVRGVELWGAGSDVDSITFKQRTHAKRVAEERARSVNRRHMAGDRAADMFILEAAGVLAERHERPDLNK